MDKPVQAAPPQLKINGAAIVNNSSGCTVRLRGVDIDGLEFGTDVAGPTGGVTGVASEAISVWKCNVIRLPLNQDRWFFYPDSYRTLVDSLVNYCSSQNCYVILDLHWSGTCSTCGTTTGTTPVTGNGWGSAVTQMQMPDANSITFWSNVASRYANNPAVMFDLYNEPNGVSASVWLNGGSAGSFNTPGMKNLLSTIRGTGAKNIVLAGGLSWCNDFSQILPANALTDSTGYGVLYDAHIYSNNGNQTVNVSTSTYPFLVGEFGLCSSCSPDGGTWDNNFISYLNTNNLSWTAWNMATSGPPTLISDWNYTATSYHGVPVKNSLTGTANPACDTALGGPTYTPTATPTQGGCFMLSNFTTAATYPYSSPVNTLNGKWFTFDWTTNGSGVPQTPAIAYMSCPATNDACATLLGNAYPGPFGETYSAFVSGGYSSNATQPSGYSTTIYSGFGLATELTQGYTNLSWVTNFSFYIRTSVAPVTLRFQASTPLLNQQPVTWNGTVLPGGGNGNQYGQNFVVNQANTWIQESIPMSGMEFQDWCGGSGGSCLPTASGGATVYQSAAMTQVISFQWETQGAPTTLGFSINDFCLSGSSFPVTPTPSAVSSTSTPTLTPTRTATATATKTTTFTATNTVANTSTSTPTLTPTASPTVTRTSTPTNTVANTSTFTATNTATNSATSSPTRTTTLTPTATATNTLANTGTPTSSATNTTTSTATNTAANTSTNTSTKTATNTATGSPTSTPTLTLTETATNTLVNTGTPTSTATKTATSTVTNTTTSTATSTPTRTATFTVTTTPTNTLANTATNTATLTASLTPSSTATRTTTATTSNTATKTATATITDTPTDSGTPTPTATGTIPTATNTPTSTPTGTATLTATKTASSTATQTATNSATDTATRTATFTATATTTNTLANTATHTASSTPTNTLANTATNTPSLTPTSTLLNTATSTPTRSATSTATFTTTSSPTQSATRTATSTPTDTLVNTATPSFTPSSTPTVLTVTASQGTNPPPNATPLAGTSNVPVQQMVLTNPSSSIVNMSAVTLTVTGTGNPMNITSVTLFANGVSVGSMTFTGTTAVFNLSGTLPGNSSVTYTASANFGTNASGSYNFSVTGASGTNGQPVVFSPMPVLGADIAVAQATATPTKTTTVTPSFTPTSTSTNTLTPTNTCTATVTNSPTIPFTATSSPTSTPVANSTPVVFPNPSTGGNVTLMANLNQPVSGLNVSLYTTAFRMVQSTDITTLTPNVTASALPGTTAQSWKIPLVMTDKDGHLLASGLYYVVITINGQRYSVTKLLLLR